MYEELISIAKSLLDSKDEGSSRMLMTMYDLAVKKYGTEAADKLLDAAMVIMDGPDNDNRDSERGNSSSVLDSDAVEHHQNEERPVKVPDGGEGTRREPDNRTILPDGNADIRPGDTIKRRYLPGDGTD